MRNFIVVIAVMLLGCTTYGGCGASPVPTPEPNPEPTPTEATCEAVCDHGDTMACDWAAKEADCVNVCNNVQASGILKWNLDCRLAAQSCAAVDECER